jgi:hypothetical protein
MKDYVVILTNSSKSQWPYCVKAVNEEAAVRAAKKLHHHTPGMPRTWRVSVETDSRSPRQRAHELATERANNWRKSLEYRYGPIVNEVMVQEMLQARVNSMYHEVYEGCFMADFEVWLKGKRKEVA